MSILSLNGSDWKLLYVKNETLVKDGFAADLKTLEARGYATINASVPGNIELDMMNAGLKEDPFYGRNMRDRSCEYLHAFYYRTFDYDGSMKKPSLVFEGLDTVADIYLNGSLIGSTDNMLIPHQISVSEALIKGSNLLLVHIKPVVIEARNYPLTLHDTAQLYNRESLYIRKAAHMFGWDICPRIVSCGIWRPVYLKDIKADRISEFYIATDSVNLENETAKLHCLLNTELAADEIQRYSITLDAQCGESVFHDERALQHSGAHWCMDVANILFWWPRNSGKQNLYNISVTLLKDGVAVDTYSTRLGIRTVDLDRTSLSDEEGKNSRFQFLVNGKKIFILGTNWVPTDSLHSRDKQRIASIVPMLNDLKCNMIRIWGGGVYEDDLLYNFCDENGILIWHDFMMGCGTYPQDDEFQRKLTEETTIIVKRLRQHPSIALWAGNNENDIAYLGWSAKPRNPNNDRTTRETLPRVLWMHDFYRPYLPSSPYIDQFAFENMSDTLKTTEDHLWGPRDYFKGKFYGTSVCQFASETGYHGCPSPAALRKFIPEEYLWTSQNNANWQGIDNPMWLSHASTIADKDDPFSYRIRLMADQVTTLFGTSVPNTLDDFARASQISQAEAKKFFIERFRVTKWRRTGLIWWNLIDCWSHISDAIVDYSLCKKLAYFYIKRSQEPICLICNEPQNGLLPLHAVNDLPVDMGITYTVKEVSSSTIVASGTTTARADSSTLISAISVAPEEQKFYYITWTTEDGKTYSNHYMTGLLKIDYSTYMGYLAACGYNQFEGF